MKLASLKSLFSYLKLAESDATNVNRMNDEQKHAEQKGSDFDRDARRFRYVENSGALFVEKSMAGYLKQTRVSPSRAVWRSRQTKMCPFSNEREEESERNVYFKKQVFEEIENMIRERDTREKQKI